MTEIEKKILASLPVEVDVEKFIAEAREKCKGEPPMSEEEARQILREFMERPLKGKEWPKVWIGEVIEYDRTGYSFQATYYGKGYVPGSFWQNWGVDAKTHECMIALM